MDSTNFVLAFIALGVLFLLFQSYQEKTATETPNRIIIRYPEYGYGYGYGAWPWFYPRNYGFGGYRYGGYRFGGHRRHRRWRH